MSSLVSASDPFVVAASPASGGGRLFERTYEALGRQIVTRQLPPGAVLAPEELGASLDVSRTVLREVFRALQGSGLLTAKPKVGTQVTDPAQWNYLDPDVIRWRLEGADRSKQVADLYSVRVAIEPVAARLVSAQADLERIADLTSAIDDMYVAMERKDLHSFTDADVRFHLTLVEASGNAMFRRLSNVIESAVRTREALLFPLGEAMIEGLTLHRMLVREIATQAESVEETSRRLIIDAQHEADLEITRQLRRSGSRLSLAPGTPE